MTYNLLKKSNIYVNVNIYKMSLSKRIFIIFLLCTFLLGLYITVYWDISVNLKTKENMENSTNTGCPDLLIQKGNSLLLYNTKKPEDETNPISFFNLDEYINYLEIQKKKGNACPVLFLQQENNAQGDDVYRVRPSPFDLQGGLQHDPEQVNDAIAQVNDASRANPPYNKDQYHGFDPNGQHIGEYTNVDAIHDSTNAKKISDNPMDSKWAGITYTQQMIDSGKYVDNEIVKPSLFNAKTVFFPSIPSVVPPPKDIIG
jgi:hypothetical protein